MTDLIFAGALAAMSRWIRLRDKRKHPERQHIEIHLPEILKYGITFLFMIVWVKFVNLFFAWL